jgi:hypothetical protein
VRPVLKINVLAPVLLVIESNQPRVVAVVAAVGVVAAEEDVLVVLDLADKIANKLLLRR